MLLMTLNHETSRQHQQTLTGRFSRALIFSVCLLAGLMSALTSAGEGRQHRFSVPQGQAAQGQAATISADRAVAIAKQGQDCKVLKVDRGDRSYRIKLLTANGVVKQVVVNALTGQIESQ